jgi:hypothetical protein
MSAFVVLEWLKDAGYHRPLIKGKGKTLQRKRGFVFAIEKQQLRSSS